MINEKMIYLDNSATTLPSDSILETFVQINKQFFGNPASIHRLGVRAEKLLAKSREQIASLVGVKNGKVIFTSGGTEANNLALLGLARYYKTRGNHIITTKIEHPSILNSAEQLEREGFDVDYLSVDEQGVISLDELREKIRPETIAVSIMHVNNEIGAIQPIEQCSQLIKEVSRAIVHVDAIQSYGKLPIDMDKQGIDALSISAHKINGLKGSGTLVLRNGVHVEAINYGGGQEEALRNGTVSVAHAATLAKAMRLASENTKSATFQKWRNRIIEKAQTRDNILVLSEDAGAPHIVSLAFPHIKGEVAINFFQEEAIYLSTSSACSSKDNVVSHVVEAIRVDELYKFGVVRLSFGQGTTEQDIVRFENALMRFIQVIERGNSR